MDEGEVEGFRGSIDRFIAGSVTADVEAQRRVLRG